MKKVFAVVCSIVLLFSVVGMTACSGEKKGNALTATDETGENAYLQSTSDGSLPEPDVFSTQEPVTMAPGKDYVDGTESFTLSADKTTAAPGETVTLTLHAENCKNVACFDIRFSASEGLTDVSAKEKESGEFITTVSEIKGGVQYSAIVATTSNIDSLDMLTISYKVAADAAPGDVLTVSAEFSQYLVGTDESGDNVADATGLIEVAPVTITVA